MTFEAAACFLTDATLAGVADDLALPASSIVAGRVVRLGTGACKFLQNLGPPAKGAPAR